MINNSWELEPDIVSYSLRNPLLFGDFRNAYSEDEVRLYEDLLDYEAVFNLFMEVFLMQHCPLLLFLRSSKTHPNLHLKFYYIPDLGLNHMLVFLFEPRPFLYLITRKVFLLNVVSLQEPFYLWQTVY